MSPLDKVYYSRGGCIAAVRDYCSFLRNMYLDESLVLEPSEGGWRNVKAENIPGFDETDEVFALLGHLSYIDSGSDRIAHGNSCYFLADWQVLAGNDPNEDAQDLKLATEEDFDDEAPAPVVRLTNSDNILSFILLDTELGIVHWRVCPHEWRYNQRGSKSQTLWTIMRPTKSGEAMSLRGLLLILFKILKDHLRGPELCLDQQSQYTLCLLKGPRAGRECSAYGKGDLPCSWVA